MELTPIKNVARTTLGVGVVLLVPLTLTVLNPHASIYGGPGGGWDWMPGDFIVMGVLLFLTATGIEFSLNNISNPVYTVVVIVSFILLFLFVWVELAVGGVSQMIHFFSS